MIKKKKGLLKKGIIVFSSPSSQGYKIIENWNDHKIVDSGELQTFSVKEKETKTSLKPKTIMEKVAGVGFGDLLAASTLGYR